MIFYRVRRLSDHSWSTLCCGVQVIRLQCISRFMSDASSLLGRVTVQCSPCTTYLLSAVCIATVGIQTSYLYLLSVRLRTSQFDHNWLYSSDSIVRLKSFGAQPRNGWTEPPPFKLWVNSTFQKVTYSSVIKWLYLLTYLHHVLILYVGLKFIVWSSTSTLTLIILLKAKHSITARVLWFVSPKTLRGLFLNFWNEDDHPVNT